MKVTSLKTNRIINPLGFCLGTPRLSFIAEETAGKKIAAARVRVSADEDFTKILSDSGKRADMNALAFSPEIALKPRTRYYWKASVWADNGDFAESETAWFETAKMSEPWRAKWISPGFDGGRSPVMKKTFAAAKEIKRARAYITGLGLYELYINGKKIGNEFLTPNVNAYNLWIQYQTYDITGDIKQKNDIEVLLGNGWYKGRYFFDDLNARRYGDQFLLLCEIVLEYRDGSSEAVCTDGSWTAQKSNITDGSIYDGEACDASADDKTQYKVVTADKDYGLLKERLSLPCVVKERIKPVKYIKTPSGEDVLDMGQNMVGHLEFKVSAPNGTRIKFQFGEILEDGNFYRENLRSAKQEYDYVCDGTERTVRQHFTFYGFRYVKLSGWQGKIDLSDFTGLVIYSDLEETGKIETGNPLINRLFLNAKWGQKGNFLDIPTDCPQRDERMGWTGDAQVFTPTACFNMDTYAFYNKFLFDLYKEQSVIGGAVPNVVPNVIRLVSEGWENFTNGARCGWADAATVMPWTVYRFYGDKAILRQQFESMKAWVDYIKAQDEKTGGKRLWTTGVHYGDWCALDVDTNKTCVGATDVYYLASAYYCHSAGLVSKAAGVLGKTDTAAEYKKLSDEVRAAIQKEYFTKTGRLAVPTQTAHIVALYMDLTPARFKKRTVSDLKGLFERNEDKLTTGFLGVSYMCKALSDNGLNDLAYKLLLNREYPGWLYSVTMGATTVWERWNSVLPDGRLSGTGMNSLNHYAYGSVVEWMYSYMCGIKPIEEEPGFSRIRLEPLPNREIGFAKASYRSASGLYKSGWEFIGKNKILYEFEIPFNCEAVLKLPGDKEGTVLTAGAHTFEKRAQKK